MNFSNVYENPIIFLSWVTTFGLFISLTEATLKIRYEININHKKREKLIARLYPEELA